jgi:predicted metal-binding protein
MRSTPTDIANSDPLVDQAVTMPVDRIALQDWVRDSCRDCKYHGRSWSCPPGVGSLENARESLSGYSCSIFLRFKTSRDRQALEKSVLGLEAKLRENGFPRALGFFTSPCTACKVCSYPSPCRKPELCRPTAESWGIDLLLASQDAGLPVEPVMEGEDFMPVTIILLD